VRSGQFQQSLSEGDEVIFDDDEPVGEMTDTFPDVSPADITTDAEEEQRD
jgi:hypothetical protein